MAESPSPSPDNSPADSGFFSTGPRSDGTGPRSFGTGVRGGSKSAREILVETVALQTRVGPVARYCDPDNTDPGAESACETAIQENVKQTVLDNPSGVEEIEAFVTACINETKTVAGQKKTLCFNGIADSFRGFGDGIQSR